MRSRTASTACRARCADERGQGTVEFAVVTAAFVALIVALGAMWRLFGEGKAMEHALASASHHIELSSAGAVDVLLY